MNLEELLAQATTNDAPGLTDEQQQTRLEEWFAQVHAAAPERFEPGDVIWHRHPSAAITRHASAPHMFVEYLPTEIDGMYLLSEPQDVGSSAAAMHLDCRIALVTAEDRIAVHLMDSRQFSRTRPKRSANADC